MEYVNKVNILSPELKARIKAALPKQGQVVYFESLRPKARGTTAVSIDRIFDPWHGKNDDGEFVGDYVDIAYITGRNPGKGAGEKPTDTYGRIQFRNRPDGGRIAIRGGNRGDELMFEYLFLTNQNQSNSLGKAPWFVASEMRQPCFRTVQKSLDATQIVEKKRAIRQAGQIIDEMPDEKLREFAIGLDFKGINKFSSPDEIRVQLLKMADSDGGAERILGLDKNVTVKMKVCMKDAERYSVIKRDSALGFFVWGNSGEPICVVPPGKNLFEFTINYFLTDKGKISYDMIKTLVEQEKEREVVQKKVEEPVKTPDKVVKKK